LSAGDRTAAKVQRARHPERDEVDDLLRRRIPLRPSAGRGAARSHLDERQILRDAHQRGIRLYGLTDYQFESHTAAPGLVLGYAGLPTHAIDDGIAELASLITGSSGRSARSLTYRPARPGPW
jgi:hypothetical protein